MNGKRIGRVRRPLNSNPRPPRQDRGYDERHYRLRRMKLRADPICEYCRQQPATELDHYDGNSRNTRWSNLRSTCGPCHRRKSVLKDGGFGRAKS